MVFLPDWKSAVRGRRDPRFFHAELNRTELGGVHTLRRQPDWPGHGDLTGTEKLTDEGLQLKADLEAIFSKLGVKAELLPVPPRDHSFFPPIRVDKKNMKKLEAMGVRTQEPRQFHFLPLEGSGVPMAMAVGGAVLGKATRNPVESRRKFLGGSRKSNDDGTPPR